jgi:hypothetical protein
MILPAALRFARAPILLLSLSLAACSGSSADPAATVNSGYEALNGGNAEKALDLFAKALQDLKPSDPLYESARMGEIQAKVELKPDAAKSSFLEYAKANPEQLEAGDYRKVGQRLTERKAIQDAVEVLHAGIERFPEDAKLKETMNLTVAAAEQSNDTSALNSLKGLGYIGD